ncbi:MAG TPA: hypothetical protein VFZ27_18450 [Terriglobia bacterium]|nr:hypothetical protein [Terriglobia bacterium]
MEKENSALENRFIFRDAGRGTCRLATELLADDYLIVMRNPQNFRQLECPAGVRE